MSGAGPTLGDYIAQLRQARGLSQAQLATAIGVTRTNVSKWENDLSRPTRQHLALLHEVLGDEGRLAGMLDFAEPMSVSALQRRTVAALIEHLSEDEAADGDVGYGWRHDMDDPHQPLTALSTAYGLRAVLQAVGPDRRISLPRVRTVLQRLEQPGGGWSPVSTAGRPRPEVTAVVVSALHDAGEADDFVAERIGGLVELLEGREGTHSSRPYVLGTTLLELGALAVDDATGRRLVDRLVDMSVAAGDGDRGWPVSVRSRRGLGGAPLLSTAHTAIAVCALAAWARRLDDDEIHGLASAGRTWLELNSDLTLEDEWFSDGDDPLIPVLHFTPAWVLRALIESGGDATGALAERALRATLSYYFPEASLWRWTRHGGMFPVWMTCHGLAAVAAWGGARELA